MTVQRAVTYGPPEAWGRRHVITFLAIAAALVLLRDRVPALAYGTLILAGLYLVTTNAAATGRAITYLTDPKS